METKVEVEDKPLSQEDFKKLEEVQQQVEEIDTNQEEKDTFQNTGCCFEGFCRHKFLFINCIIDSNGLIGNFIRGLWKYTRRYL
jgi:hypothetical protein